MPTRFLATALLAAGVLAAAAPPAPAQCTKATTRPFAAADLVIPAPKVKVCPPTGAEAPQATRENDLINLIVSTVSPQTWQQNGGTGSIAYEPVTMSLVINQTPDVQEQVADLLAALRRLQDQEVVLDVRLLSVPEGGLCERVGVDFNNAGCDHGCAEPLPRKINTAQAGKWLKEVATTTGKVQFLDDSQLHLLLESVQADPQTHVMQFPRMTLASGQTGVLDVNGFRLSAQGVISADRRFVRLRLKADQSDKQQTAAPISVPDGGTVLFSGVKAPQCAQTPEPVCVPDGGTVLMAGRKFVVESQKEFCPPAIARSPYVNRLFRTPCCREAQQVFVLVTPRIVVHEEEEQKVGVGTAVQAVPCPTAACPVLGAVPFVGRLFTQGGYGRDTEKLLLMVSPRVLINEEEEEKAAPYCHEAEATCASQAHQSAALAELLKAYDEACAAGRTAEAKKIARAALTLDPTCFRRR
jgi:hypothetical protein